MTKRDKFNHGAYTSVMALGDCLKLMEGIGESSIDLLIGDLPYGVTQNKNDIPINLKDFWREVNRIMKPNGVVALFAQGLFYVDIVQSNRKNFRYDIIWDKVLTSGFLNAKRMPLRQHEQVAIFYEKLPTYNPQFTEGKPLHSKGTSYMDKEHKNQNYGKFEQTPDNRKGSTEKYPTSIWRAQKPHPSNALHATAKSVEFCEQLIKTYSNEGDTVFDPTMGSGTTFEAAINTNRRFIGIELDADVYDVAVTRIMEHLKK